MWQANCETRSFRKDGQREYATIEPTETGLNKEAIVRRFFGAALLVALLGSMVGMAAEPTDMSLVEGEWVNTIIQSDINVSAAVVERFTIEDRQV